MEEHKVRLKSSAKSVGDDQIADILGKDFFMQFVWFRDVNHSFLPVKQGDCDVLWLNRWIGDLKYEILCNSKESWEA